MGVSDGNGNAKLVTILFAICMFLAGIVVSGTAGILWGDHRAVQLEQRASEERKALEGRINRRIDDTLIEINRRLDQIDRRMERAQ